MHTNPLWNPFRTVTAGTLAQAKLGTPLPVMIEPAYSKLDQFTTMPAVGWRFRLRRNTKDNRHWTWSKMPVNPTDGTAARPNDPDTWGTFEAALGYWREHNHDDDPYTVANGIGIMLEAGCGLVGGDIDHCIDQEGILNTVARELLALIGPTYVEVSPSGTGIRYFLRGQLPVGLRRNDDVGCEVYDDLRFLTLTGVTVDDSPIADDQNIVDKLHDLYFHANTRLEYEPDSLTPRDVVWSIPSGNDGGEG